MSMMCWLSKNGARFDVPAGRQGHSRSWEGSHSNAWKPTWELHVAKKIPGICFGQQRRRVSSAEVPFWLRRWRWGHGFVLGCPGQEMPALHFHLSEWRLFSFLIKLRPSCSALSRGLQPGETHSLWVTNSGEEGGLTCLSWELWWKGHVQRKGGNLFVSSARYSLLCLFSTGVYRWWIQPLKICSYIKFFGKKCKPVLGFCEHKCHGEK